MLINKTEISNSISIQNCDKNSCDLIWNSICSKFSKIHGEAIFNSWIKPLNISSIESGFIEIISPSRFVKDWVNSNYLSVLSKLFAEEIEDFKRLEILTKKPAATSIATIIENEIKEAVANESSIKNVAEAKKNQLSLDLGKQNFFEELLSNKLDTRFTFDNFYAFENNILAYQGTYQISIKGDDIENFNPLFICGKVGLGKSHLLQAAAANAIKLNSYKKVLYLSAEKFMFGYVRALKENKLIDFKDFVRSADLLLVDDIQFICGKNNFQEEFFHTINSVIDAGGKVILSADKFPHQMDGLDEKIKSRFSGGLIADVKPYSVEQRIEILNRKKQQYNISISAEIINYIANAVTTSIRELEAALNKIIQIAKLTNKQIDFELVSGVIKASYSRARAEVTLDEVKKKVCAKFGLTNAEIESSTRLKKISEARQIAMYIAKKHTAKSFPEIGRFFGGKDHATVIHAVKKIEKLIAENQKYADIIDVLSAEIVG